MTDASDLSSTEKLLDSIRGDTPPQAFSREPVPPLPESKGRSSLKGNALNNLCAGVYLGGDCLSLVLTGETKRGGAKEVVKWQVFPYPENMNMKSDRFPAFLRSALGSFLTDSKNASIWAAIETKDVKLRQLTLPNIPDAKLANAAMWALKKEIEIDLVNEIFDYEFISDVHVSGVKKKNVVAFSGDRAAVKGLKALFKSAGYSLAGITATPFAIQNCILAGQPDTGGQPVVIVNIRRHRSEIFCMSEQGILVARSIKTGSYSLVESSMESGESGMVTGNITDIPGILAARDGLDDPGFEEMDASARRLLGKIQRTGEYCSNVFLENEPVAKYYFFGETDDSRAFINFSKEMIPGRATLFSPFQNDPDAMGLTMPTRAADRNGVIPALGIALSDKGITPNFLYTYKEKALESKAKKINMGIIAAGIAGLMICAGIWFWFDRMENREIARRTSVETQLAKYDTQVTTDVLNKKNDQAKKKMEMIRQYANDYESLSVISEVCALTPENIDLLTLEADLAEPVDKDPKAKNEKRVGERGRHLRLQGVVSAEFTALESTLTGYVMTLGDSPLFGNIEVENKKIEQKKDLNMLNFTVDMEIF